MVNWVTSAVVSKPKFVLLGVTIEVKVPVPMVALPIVALAPVALANPRAVT